MDKILIGILSFLVGIGLGLLLFWLIPVFKAKQSLQKSQKIVKDAEIKSEHILKNADLDAKQILYEGRQELDREDKERRGQINELQRLVVEREKAMERRDQVLLSKEQSLDDRHDNLSRRLKEVDKLEEELKTKINSILSELEKVANMTVGEAKEELYTQVNAKLERELALYIKNREEEAETTANDTAREILANAIAKYSQEVTTERTVSVVHLPNDEMKGRIIGREGRNIRSLEQLLGVDILIDDTPEVITVSSFDPIRRETARRAVEALVSDGRIQPSRIEEVVEKVKGELDEVILKTGKDAVAELGIPNVHKDMLKYIGRLKYRTSYGQSALKHSVEVAHLAGIMAAELGLNILMAKRAGLFHDIGKAADFELEGSHVEIGARLAKKYGEADYVIDGIESHHGDKPARFIYSQLVIAADTLSAARPGARTETLENYIKRLEQLEEICKSFDGVHTSFAMQSGREVRVMVVPDKIDDVAVNKLAREIREKIEDEMTYPGQIKVSVIREYRATEVAK
ncbi:MAG TPA: ribonuclease Y [Bacilli bacterium]|nr:ribonuclease Y [Bacilli bacterium]